MTKIKSGSTDPSVKHLPSSASVIGRAKYGAERAAGEVHPSTAIRRFRAAPSVMQDYGGRVSNATARSIPEQAAATHPDTDPHQGCSVAQRFFGCSSVRMAPENA